RASPCPSALSLHDALPIFRPGFGFEAFAEFVRATPGEFPTREGQSIDELLEELRPVMFDPSVDAKLVNRAAGVDPVAASAVNFRSEEHTSELQSRENLVCR